MRTTELFWLNFWMLRIQTKLWEAFSHTNYVRPSYFVHATKKCRIALIGFISNLTKKELTIFPHIKLQNLYTENPYKNTWYDFTRHWFNCRETWKFCKKYQWKSIDTQLKWVLPKEQNSTKSGSLCLEWTSEILSRQWTPCLEDETTYSSTLNA